MPTKLSLTLDAAQYQQQLEAVVQQTRQAAAQMEALNTDRQVTVTADTQPAEKALSDLSDKSDLSDLSDIQVSVTADTSPAEKNIDELTKAYGDLGIKLDETTGKLTGVDSAMIKKAEKDKARRIKELEAELRELENSNQQQAELRDKAGIPVWFGGKVRIGGKETSEAAARKIEENNQRIMVIRRNLHDLRQSDPAGEIRRLSGLPIIWEFFWNPAVRES